MGGGEEANSQQTVHWKFYYFDFPTARHFHFHPGGNDPARGRENGWELPVRMGKVSPPGKRREISMEIPGCHGSCPPHASGRAGGRATAGSNWPFPTDAGGLKVIRAHAEGPADRAVRRRRPLIGYRLYRLGREAGEAALSPCLAPLVSLAWTKGILKERLSLQVEWRGAGSGGGIASRNGELVARGCCSSRQRIF